jgi:hypothetical protein
MKFQLAKHCNAGKLKYPFISGQLQKLRYWNYLQRCIQTYITFSCCELLINTEPTQDIAALKKSKAIF